jgi:hypothetical protein
MAARIISSSKTTLRSAGARACGNHQAIDISPLRGEERRTTSVALQVESANFQVKQPSKETTVRLTLPEQRMYQRVTCSFPTVASLLPRER